MVYVIFGHSWLAAGIANAILGTVSVAITYRLAREFLSIRHSLAAASVMAFLPSQVVVYTTVLLSEPLHMVLVLLALIMTCRTMGDPTWKNAALLGLVIGVGLYVRPILLLFPIPVTLLLAMRKRVSISPNPPKAGVG